MWPIHSISKQYTVYSFRSIWSSDLLDLLNNTSASEESAAVVRKTVRGYQSNRFFTRFHCSAYPLSHAAFLHPLWMTRCQVSCFPYYNKISAAGEMLYFSLLHLYGTNDSWGTERAADFCLSVSWQFFYLWFGNAAIKKPLPLQGTVFCFQSGQVIAAILSIA